MFLNSGGGNRGAPRLAGPSTTFYGRPGKSGSYMVTKHPQPLMTPSGSNDNPAHEERLKWLGGGGWEWPGEQTHLMFQANPGGTTEAGTPIEGAEMMTRLNRDGQPLHFGQRSFSYNEFQRRQEDGIPLVGTKESGSVGGAELGLQALRNATPGQPVSTSRGNWRQTITSGGPAPQTPSTPGSGPQATMGGQPMNALMFPNYGISGYNPNGMQGQMMSSGIPMQGYQNALMGL